MLGVFGIMKLAKITGSAILMTSSFPEILLTPEFGVTCYGISKVQGRHFKRFQPWYIFRILKRLPIVFHRMIRGDMIQPLPLPVRILYRKCGAFKMALI